MYFITYIILFSLLQPHYVKMMYSPKESIIHPIHLTQTNLNQSMPNISMKQQHYCEQYLMKILNNSQRMVEDIPNKINNESNSLNRTIDNLNLYNLSIELCNLKLSPYGHNLHLKWTNSTQRYLTKIILGNTIIPLIYLIDLLLLTCLICPIVYQLSKNSNLSIWYFLTYYTLIRTFYIVFVHLPKFIVNFTTWITKNHPYGIESKLREFRGLEHLGKIYCPIFTILLHILENSPNWIITILVWEQLVHCLLNRKLYDRSKLTHHEDEDFQQPTQICHSRRFNQRINSDYYNGDSSMERSRYGRIGSQCIGNEIACANLTRFGAKLLTITILVLMTFVNVHSLWLFNYANGKCAMDAVNHSPIFAVAYPYFLRVIQCTIPNVCCTVNVVVFVYLKIFHLHCGTVNNFTSSPPCDTIANDHLPIEDKIVQQNSVEYSQPSKLTPLNQGNRKCDHDQVVKGSDKKSMKIIQLKQYSITLRYASLCTTTDPTLTESSQGTTPQAFDRQVLVEEHKLELINLAFALAVFHLLFNLPSDIEWFYTQSINHNQLINEDIVYYYELIKLSQLVEHILQLWSALQMFVYFPLIYYMSYITRRQTWRCLNCTKHFYCSVYKFNCCLCGYKCNGSR